MRVLHVNARYYPYVGGSEIYCQEISERLVRNGHEVSVFTTNAWDLEYFWHPDKKHLAAGKEQHNGVEVERFAVKHLLSSRLGFAALRYLMQVLASLPVDTTPLLFRLCPYLPWVPGLGQRLSEEPASYDIVHVMNITFDSMIYATYRFARRCGIPLVITPFLHLGEPGDKKVRQYYTMPHQVAMLRNCRTIIVQTELEGDYLLSRGISADQICKIGVGINPQDLLGGCGSRFREKYRLHTPLVFYIGMQAYDKGTIHLIQAMAQLWEQGSQADLVLAGPVMSQVQEYLLALPDTIRQRCHFLGFVSEGDKRDLLDAGNIFVMPSRTDSFGIVY
ncbi:MAG: glycosyltransferase family 4 protein, partial [Chloroflexi bacterium]|nr:glycosyltransferase family 4 protein [Chloroflexota bacterium]